MQIAEGFFLNLKLKKYEGNGYKTFSLLQKSALTFISDNAQCLERHFDPRIAWCRQELLLDVHTNCLLSCLLNIISAGSPGIATNRFKRIFADFLRLQRRHLLLLLLLLRLALRFVLVKAGGQLGLELLVVVLEPLLELFVFDRDIGSGGEGAARELVAALGRVNRQKGPYENCQQGAKFVSGHEILYKENQLYSAKITFIAL